MGPANNRQTPLKTILSTGKSTLSERLSMAAHDHRPARSNKVSTPAKPESEPDFPADLEGQTDDGLADGVDLDDAAWDESETEPADEIWDSLELDDDEPEPDE